MSHIAAIPLGVLVLVICAVAVGLVILLGLLFADRR